MSSFNLESLKCTTCPLKPEHIVLYREANEKRNLFHYPSVFIISDQSFPPNIPTGGEGECLKIVRVEDGSLDELAAVFLEIIRPYAVPAGTVVLLHSISHLAWVGAAAFAEDFVRCLQRICGVYRSGISVIHGVSVLLGGSNLRPLSSDLNIVLDWYSSTRHMAERDIVDSMILGRLFTISSPLLRRWRQWIAVSQWLRGSTTASRLPPATTATVAVSLWLCHRSRTHPVSLWLRLILSSEVVVSLWLCYRLLKVQVVRLWRRCPVRLWRRGPCC